jgi:hypothetical protein
MKRSVVHTLILSDLDRHRFFVLLSILGGVIALALVQMGSELTAVLGSTWFFVSLIVLGSMLPISNLVFERKKQTLPFLMSLPVSISQYTTAKLVSTFGLFLLPWSSLVLGGLWLIAARDGIPNGAIPALLILAGLTFVGFCGIAAVALASESEGWTTAATVALNSSYGFGWYLIIRNPTLRAGFGNPEPVWSPEVLTILLAEVAAVALMLALTFFVQSRKRDFV